MSDTPDPRSNPIHPQYDPSYQRNASREQFPAARCKAPGVHMWEAQYDSMIAEIENLRRWKVEAIAVSQQWDALQEEIPATFSERYLGVPWPKIVAEYLSDLEMRLEAVQDGER
jgi:hypothetical protein